MKRLVLLACALILSGCANMTPTQKKVAWVAAGVVVTSIAISTSSDVDPAALSAADSKQKVCEIVGSTVICRME